MSEKELLKELEEEMKGFEKIEARKENEKQKSSDSLMKFYHGGKKVAFERIQKELRKKGDDIDE